MFAASGNVSFCLRISEDVDATSAHQEDVKACSDALGSALDVAAHDERFVLSVVVCCVDTTV